MNYEIDEEDGRRKRDGKVYDDLVQVEKRGKGNNIEPKNKSASLATVWGQMDVEDENWISFKRFVGGGTSYIRRRVWKAGKWDVRKWDQKVPRNPRSYASPSCKRALFYTLAALQTCKP